MPLNYVVAVNNATMGWPSYWDSYGTGGNNLLLQHEVFSDMNFASPPPGRAFTRTPNLDPPSSALAAPEAQIADAEEFRTCGKDGVLETGFGRPLV